VKTIHLIALLCASLVAFPAPANEAIAEPSPEAIVQAQLEAYNRRDLEGFLSFYSDDAVLLNYPDQVTQIGKDQMRARLRKALQQPQRSRRNRQAHRVRPLRHRPRTNYCAPGGGNARGGGDV
jgi:hypothetical protein